MSESSLDADAEFDYAVVINDEEQHSIWPAHLAVPAGWHEVGVSGSKDHCLDHIERVWLDITPLSVRAKASR